MRKRQRNLKNYRGVLLLICALGLAYGAVSGQDSPPEPRGGAISERPNYLEGNWFFEWDGYPTGAGSTRGAATIVRKWEQTRIEVIGDGGSNQGGSYHNIVSQTDKSWRLGYTTDFENWGGLTLQPNQQGNLEIRWGSWDGHTSELKQNGRDELRGVGHWTYLKPLDTGGFEGVPLEGAEVWRRALPRITRVVFKIASYTWGEDPSAIESVWTPGDPPARIESTYSADDFVRGNRPQFKAEIYGENLWGHHLIDVGGAVDLEPLPEWRYYILKDGSKTTDPRDPNQVARIDQYVVVWSKARPGKYTLRVDGFPIPFELVIKDYPVAAVTSSEQTVEPEGRVIPIVRTIMTMLAIFVAFAAATAVFGPAGVIALGAALTGKSLWESYQKGGTKQIFEDLGAFDLMDAAFRPGLTVEERRRKFLSGAVNFGGVALDVVPAVSGTIFGASKLGRWLFRSAVGKGGSVIQKIESVLEGRRALNAARRAAGGKETKYITQKLGAVDSSRPHKSLDKTPPPTNRTPRLQSRSARRAEDMLSEVAGSKRPRKSRPPRNTTKKPAPPEERPLKKFIREAADDEPARQAREAAREALQRAEKEVMEIVSHDLPGVNDAADLLGQGNRNCYSCAIAADQRLALNASEIPSKRKSMALPSRGVKTADVEEMLRRRYGTVNQHDGRTEVQEVIQVAPAGQAGRAEIHEAIDVLGEGARGIILVKREGQVEGHAFNVVNHKGQVVFFDSQSSKIVPNKYWDDVSEVSWVRTDGFEDVR